MNRSETIRYIRKIKKNIKKCGHDYLSCYGRRGVFTTFKTSPLEIAARFLRRKGYAIDIRINVAPLSHFYLGKYLRCLRYVFINY
uniref:Uncharacterized protein n=1 Tax=Phage sp. ctL4h4 TaxID=2828005 RepID=A0A8S5TH06_9VIRU|nr:MAG TPA: hypothetical protein [Phage sp. ctL4h4]